MEIDPSTMHTSLIVVCTLSLIGNCFISIIYFGYKSLRSYILLLVVLMLSGDSLKLIGVFISTEESSCSIAGYLFVTGALSGLFWSAIIAYTVFEAYVIYDNIFIVRKVYLAIGFGLPFCMSALPFSTKAYNYRNGYCFINESKIDMYIWRSICLYIPALIVTVFNYRKYRKVIEAIEEDMEILPNQSIVKSQRKFSRRLLIYPLIIIICYFPSLLCITIEVSTKTPDAILLICSSLECSYGLFYSLLYSCTPKIMSAVKDTIFCKKDSDVSENNKNYPMEEEIVKGSFLMYSELN
ncbi:hypothetical protein SteCoe_4040 [Stentor coeruleus]|uniref:G-protein coupled receptors family 1 profile domain-containing protein n=1 Tax=Stentor coeruleus TaxID=5963 RepID=A0A1R2CVQ9_9CILI|nr:hypothetical protein SteCoe_4040 [Stentor coeruleus]